MKKFKKSFAFILAVVLLLSVIPMSTSAADPTCITRVDITMSSLYGKTPAACKDCFTISKESHSHISSGDGLALENSKDFIGNNEKIDCSCFYIYAMIIADEGYTYDEATEIYVNNRKIDRHAEHFDDYYYFQLNFYLAPVELKETSKDVSYNAAADITIQSRLPENFTLEVNGKKEVSKGFENFTSVSLDLGQVKNPQKVTVKVYDSDGNQLFNIKGETEWTVDINVKNDIFSIIGAFFRMLFNSFDWGKSSFTVQI